MIKGFYMVSIFISYIQFIHYIKKSYSFQYLSIIDFSIKLLIYLSLITLYDYIQL